MPTEAEDARIKSGIAQDSDSPELGDDFFANAQPASELLTAEVYTGLIRRRGAGKKPAKVPVSLRLPPDVAAGLRALGAGWQTQAIEALTKLAAGDKSADPSGELSVD